MINNAEVRPHKGTSLLAFPADFTVVDLETTGYPGTGAEIIEISALRFRDDRFESSFSSLLKPSAPIPYFITSLTGITNAMVEKARDRKGVLRDFLSFLQGDIIIGHNVNFDVNFLYDELSRYLDYDLTNDFVDVMRLSRKYLPWLPNHKQVTLAEYFGQDTTGSHRAGRDTEICAENYLRIKALARRV